MSQTPKKSPKHALLPSPSQPGRDSELTRDELLELISSEDRAISRSEAIKQELIARLRLHSQRDSSTARDSPTSQRAGG